jgi:tRNA U34 5-methylaminomethyl-2-thiouridine-forming methyltransferase MnmC
MEEIKQKGKYNVDGKFDFKKYRDDNKDKIKERNDKYREDNRLAIREKNKVYYSSKKDEINAKRRVRYALKKLDMEYLENDYDIESENDSETEN